MNRSSEPKSDFGYYGKDRKDFYSSEISCWPGVEDGTDGTAKRAPESCVPPLAQELSFKAQAMMTD